MMDYSQELKPDLGAHAAAALVRNDAHWLAEFSRAARGDNTVGLLAFALFRSWHASREAEFVERTGRSAAEFDAQFLPIVRPEVLERIVADARTVLKGGRPKGVQAFEREEANGRSGRGRIAAAVTGFAACFLALLVFSAVQSIAGVPGLPFEPWNGVELSAGTMAFPGILLSGLAIGYAIRPRRRTRGRKIYYLST